MAAHLAGTRRTIILGVQCIDMKASKAPFDTKDSCPDCGDTTSVVKLGSEPAREICGRPTCGWEGATLQ